jgi:hypothetical protein
VLHRHYDNDTVCYRAIYLGGISRCWTASDNYSQNTGDEMINCILVPVAIIVFVLYTKATSYNHQQEVEKIDVCLAKHHALQERMDAFRERINNA